MPVSAGWCCPDTPEPFPGDACPDPCKACNGPPPAMIAADEFLPEIRVSVPNIPDDLIRFNIAQAAGDIAERTGLIRRTYVQPIQSGVNEYFWTSKDERPVMLHGYDIVHRGERWRRDPHGSLEAQNPWFRRSEPIISPTHTLTLPFTPECDDGCVALYYSVAPLRTACNLDSIFFHQWQPAVYHGTLAKLHAIPGPGDRPYPSFSLAVASDNRREYERYVRDIMARHHQQQARLNGMKSIMPDSFMRVGI